MTSSNRRIRAVVSIIKTCKTCKCTFEAKTAANLYCSNYCQGQAKKKPYDCRKCGNVFLTKAKSQKFCSIKCARNYASMVLLRCQECEIEFERVRSRIRGDNTFCSRECSDSASRPDRVTSIRVVCDGCETIIIRQPNAIRDRNYCTHECYANDLVVSGRLKGALHPNYNPNITEEDRKTKRNYAEYYDWRKEVYAKDRYTCRRCDSKGATLNAHHILNYSTHPNLRTCVDNGITFCQRCHREFHSTYGRSNNNAEQVYEFITKQANTEPSQSEMVGRCND